MDGWVKPGHDILLNLVHRVWRALPRDARRRGLLGLAGMLAPRPDVPPPPVRAGLAVAGELERASGLGEGARLMLSGVEALGVPGFAAGAGRTPPPEGVPLAVHGDASVLPVTMLRLGRRLLRGRRVVGVWPWELPVVPESWQQGFRYVHEVWAPSRFSAEAVRLAMPGWFRGAVRVVPYCLSCQPPAPLPLDRAALGLPEGAVITLVAFNLASSFARKNPLAAVAAHRAAFGDRGDRVLVIRVGNAAHFPNDFLLLRDAVASAPNIRIDTTIRPRAEAHAVMAACDIVLSLHRSEGFGLVPAEAMLLGKPVVATAWSGTEDFLRDEWACRVPFTLVPARDSRGVFAAPGAMWAEPDAAAAAGAMVRLADDPALRRRMGDAGRAASAGLFGPEPLAAAMESLRP